MGLDWNPGSKPKAGHEDEFVRIVRTVSADNLDPRDHGPAEEPAKGSFFSRFRLRGSEATKERLIARFNEITIPAFETLNAPRVGRDPAADEWALARYREEPRDVALNDWLRELDGYHVLDLVPPCDGLPFYSNGPLGYAELYSFRAEFLQECREIIGDELLDAAYTIKFQPTFLDYGMALLSRAAEHAGQAGISIPAEAPEDRQSLASRLHIVSAAGRWCRFWADRGHWLDPDW